MHNDNRDFDDPRLAGALRSELSREQAPDNWVQDALAIARPSGVHHALTPTAAPPLLREILPHICAVLILAGAVVGLLLQPEIAAGLWATLKAGGSPTGSVSLGLKGMGLSPAVVLGSLMVPVIVSLLAVESSRGFSDLRRWLS